MFERIRLVVLFIGMFTSCTESHSYLLLQKTGSRAQKKIWLRVQDYTIETHNRIYVKERILNRTDSALWISYTRIYRDTVTRMSENGRPEIDSTTFGVGDSLALRIDSVTAIRKRRLRSDVTAAAGFLSIMGLISVPVAALANDLDPSRAMFLGAITFGSAAVCVYGLQVQRLDLSRDWTIKREIYHSKRKRQGSK